MDLGSACNKKWIPRLCAVNIGQGSSCNVISFIPLLGEILQRRMFSIFLSSNGRWSRAAWEREEGKRWWQAGSLSQVSSTWFTYLPQVGFTLIHLPTTSRLNLICLLNTPRTLQLFHVPSQVGSVELWMIYFCRIYPTFQENLLHHRDGGLWEVLLLRDASNPHHLPHLPAQGNVAEFSNTSLCCLAYSILGGEGQKKYRLEKVEN